MGEPTPAGQTGKGWCWGWRVVVRMRMRMKARRVDLVKTQQRHFTRRLLMRWRFPSCRLQSLAICIAHSWHCPMTISILLRVAELPAVRRALGRRRHHCLVVVVALVLVLVLASLLHSTPTCSTAHPLPLGPALAYLSACASLTFTCIFLPFSRLLLLSRRRALPAPFANRPPGIPCEASTRTIVVHSVVSTES